MPVSSWGWQYPFDSTPFNPLNARRVGISDIEIAGFLSIGRILQDSFVIPFLLAVLFICAQIVHALILLRREPAVPAHTTTPGAPMSFECRGFIQGRIRELGGRTIFVYHLARLVGCFALSGISIWSLYVCSDEQKRLGSTLFPLFSHCPEFYVLLTFLYSSILAVASLAVNKWGLMATRYNIVLLLVTLGVCSRRQALVDPNNDPHLNSNSHSAIHPSSLCTRRSEGKLPLLTGTSSNSPLSSQDPMPVPNDEQTCSLFALYMYTYLDPIIFLGYRVSHLQYDQISPLSDSDYSRHLTQFAFPHLDEFQGAKRQHIFHGLMRVFRKEYIIIIFTVILQGVFQFLSPIAVNRLLKYLETQGEGAFVRPWFWILCLFCGPFFRSIAFQWYNFIATRTLVRTVGLLTQLVFEHSLRIRLKAETSDATTEPGLDPGIGASAYSSFVEVSAADIVNEVDDALPHPVSSTTSETAITGPAVAKQNTKSRPSGSTPPSIEVTKEKVNDANIVGKINNLVTTDLNNMIEAGDFILLIISVPLQVTFCVIFLYHAFVGLGAMVVLSPLPGYISKMIQSVQRIRMEKTDARIQDVTEAVNVMRMVKLFVWEAKMSKRIKDKRDDELSSLWELKLLNAVNAIVNHIIPTITMVTTYAAYTIIMKANLTPSKIFSSITVFNILRLQLNRISYQVTTIIQGKVSLDRTDEFLKKSELLDSFSDAQVPIPESLDKDVIGFKDATFAWSLGPQDGALTPSSRSFRLR
ncbi:hypothetical protein CVT25_004484, partial [Psilocybe cyanescens]